MGEELQEHRGGQRRFTVVHVDKYVIHEQTLFHILTAGNLLLPTSVFMHQLNLKMTALEHIKI